MSKSVFVRLWRDTCRPPPYRMMVFVATASFIRQLLHGPSKRRLAPIEFVTPVIIDKAAQMSI